MRCAQCLGTRGAIAGERALVSDGYQPGMWRYLNFGLATPKAACDLDRVVRPRLPLKRQATARGLIVDMSELGDVEAIEVHDLVPGCDEVVHKFLLRVRASVNF